MKLKQLLKDVEVEVRGSLAVEITGLCAHSKQVAPGNLFIAKKGHEGEAAAAGAAAILTDLYDPFLEGVVQIIHPRVATIEAALAATYFQAPDRHLFTAAVTGTNGKSTTTYLIKHLFEQMKHPCGLIGTIEWIAGDRSFPATHTTPDVLTIYKLLADMVLHKDRAAAIEVSSHGLDQGRVEGIAFDAAVFTNLTLDHLDYHKTMENYAAAKSRLFAHLKPSGVAVVNGDSPWTETLLHCYDGKRLTYGTSKGLDLFASDIALHAERTRFTIEYRGEKVGCSLPLIGRFNVYNALAATSVGLCFGFSLEELGAALKNFGGVPGRLQRVENGRGLHIFVDYAHTDDALCNVLETLREIKSGKIIVVFGCGGDRDKTKRPKMGSVAEKLADLVVVTSDNPRTEDPKEIVKEILGGLKEPKKALVHLDRAEAIDAAIRAAGKGDLVLIAGKGHEKTQTYSHQTIAFDDHKVATLASR